ncbi:NADPH-dependent FMN reductase [Thauera linaloolentis]|uniref:NADPH-dependent FMN reductase n=1 Tax=Thauera linaloolentis (strain DSM 12138 / JCM 21573 / CCUG 41526 / CIP 105981 / IAM 15112 / NBRC 102519 / 47Lol) TaxID=1123367 RepID=N6Y5H6_THAL4|nr:NADPH-dependent FMN reductase [Thauera linaloolentis]ENO89436.1 NADPH-dependent FMN reductase [Thauera linaloolentis 47Lol = DSM 12138]MCM8566927.1 NADPH-dependent FMN reductase [Thauera linaloolentis]
MSILTLSGSPSATSRSHRILQHIAAELRAGGERVDSLAIRDLPPAALCAADTKDPAIADAIGRVAGARAVIIGTPVYKAAYSGLLKTFLDLLPQDGLAGKTVLPLATGGSLAHTLALDYGLKPVLAALGAHHLLSSIYVIDAQARVEGEGLALDAAIEQRIGEGLLRLRETLSARERASATRTPAPASSGGREPLAAPLTA